MPDARTTLALAEELKARIDEHYREALAKRGAIETSLSEGGDVQAWKYAVAEVQLQEQARHYVRTLIATLEAM